MGTNTALLCKKVIENTFQVTSILYIALAQAVDCLGIADKLSPATKREYDRIRAIVPLFIEDTPFYEEIEAVENYLKENPLNLKQL
jgi:histidine ammonia-lyase